MDAPTANVETNGFTRDAHKGTERPVEPKQTGYPLTRELLRKMDAYWRAANYLPVGQIYLHDNPLLKELKLSHVRPLVVGHWGTTPGQNFIYVHLNRVIKKYDIPAKDLRFGRPSGSAMPLVWAHAEYLRLSRSLHDGRVFDMPPQTVQRYLALSRDTCNRLTHRP